ncbi:Harbinger transposase-derived nuclease [Corchorus capsularis]|uniref:Harbinger transposase-derived nuclease n=1 Tax=Corchorus capsularis TaxID=210143 RepID=A0A1R3HNM7_COCAP|nr:Harbinger transposase-derived nuclease [Corchorus capsularis]
MKLLPAHFMSYVSKKLGMGGVQGKKTIDASAEWWDNVIKERPDFKPFRKRGIDPELKDMLDCMFGDTVATGDQAWAPSSGVMPGGASTEDAAPGEGFGDSDENESEGAAKENIGEDVENDSMRWKKERYNWSHGTISRHFNDMLQIYAQLGINTIKPTEGQFDKVPDHIRYDSRYWPYFKDCIGAIDGTHIKAFVPLSQQIPYIGIAHDSRIFSEALRRQDLNFPTPPRSKYYLVDSGYPQMNGFLGPYRREHYHLPHAHSSLRSVIERKFGVWKKKWKTLKDIHNYSFKKQVLIVNATMALHNYIRKHAGSNDADFHEFENMPHQPTQPTFNQGESSSHGSSRSDSEIKLLRESIANRLMTQRETNTRT